MEDKLKVYMATEVESEQGDGYDEIVYIIAHNENEAFEIFKKEFNDIYASYLYNWCGEVDGLDEDFADCEVGIYY